GGTSLAQLLEARRGVRNHMTLSDWTSAQILAWADAFRERTGDWPLATSGVIPEASGESWCDVDRALRRGPRGLQGGSSRARLVQHERGVRTANDLSRLSRRQILAWADRHHRRTGAWPTEDSGPIPEAPGETWCIINEALVHGRRGLRGGTTL